MDIPLLAAKIPPRIERLNELAHNLWWSWHVEARLLFKSLDNPLWKSSNHNPVKLLGEIAPDRLKAVAEDTSSLKQYDSVMRAFDDDLSMSKTWFAAEHPDLSHHAIAYFSAEFAVHNSLPIYAGGLGILAGDYCKEASDLGLPLVGVGFMYPQGYFHQHILADGWQKESYEQLKFEETPIYPVLTPQGQRLRVPLNLNNQTVWVAAWQVHLGRVVLYLLDTHTEENPSWARQLSDRLYGGSRETRIQQEIVLGIGGVRILRAIGIQPTIWHANEGHTALMMLERVRELVETGMDFAKAVDRVSATTIFTTHTPVPGGHDIFTLDLVKKHLHHYWESLGVGSETFLALGKQYGARDSSFNMTVLAHRLSAQRNGVSQLHGEVSRKMWHALWPDVKEEEVPISSVTNGIHVPTWVAPQMNRLYQKYLGQDWMERHDDPALWQRILDIPDEELWAMHRWLKYKLIRFVDDRARKHWAEHDTTPGQILTMGTLLDPDALTIGFCRRFTDYKRPGLIFQDFERWIRIIRNSRYPVQIIFAGKSHPDDQSGKHLIQEIYALARDCECGGQIAFIEDYDMHMAHYLVHGIDVWLNAPRPLQEASGTSGQKAALNGVVNLSVLDGWWCEGYNGNNGWAIHSDSKEADSASQDMTDAQALYHLLEEEIVPLYYERDWTGIPRGWIKLMKESIRSIVPFFCTRRMMKEYTEQMYVEAAKSSQDT